MKRKLIALFLAIIIAIPLFSVCAQTDNIFREFISENGNVPDIVNVLETTEYDDYIFKRFTFKSIEIGGQTNIAYTIMAYPKTAGTYPGVAVYHGGDQSPSDMQNTVIRLAKAGYVAIAPELPGITNTANATNSSGAWKTNGISKMPDSTDPKDSSLYQVLIIAIQSVHLLQSNNAVTDKNGDKLDITVDKTKIGATGVSWGGYTTTMVSALLKNQINSMFSYYGCGFYDTSSFWKNDLSAMSADARTAWLKNYDAGRYAPDITANYFLATATNDLFFHPIAAKSTYDALTTENKAVLFSPNVSHQINIPSGANVGTTGGQPEIIYFDYYMKNQGSPYRA